MEQRKRHKSQLGLELVDNVISPVANVIETISEGISKLFTVLFKKKLWDVIILMFRLEYS